MVGKPAQPKARHGVERGVEDRCQGLGPPPAERPVARFAQHVGHVVPSSEMSVENFPHVTGVPNSTYKEPPLNGGNWTNGIVTHISRENVDRYNGIQHLPVILVMADKRRDGFLRGY